MITPEEFNKFEIVNGFRQCPSGDYSLIKYFGDNCHFAPLCRFGDESRFGDSCHFDINCRFGAFCIFGKRCQFDAYCHFDVNCRFDANCRFDIMCIFSLKCCFERGCYFNSFCDFGKGCHFSIECTFGNYSRFSENCTFEEYCSFEGLKFHENEKIYFIRVNNIGSRNDGCYIFNAVDDLYVRTGCFFGSKNKFLNQVREVHKGTRHEKTYKLALKLAEAQFKEV
jgi:hypothetical protein